MPVTLYLTATLVCTVALGAAACLLLRRHLRRSAQALQTEIQRRQTAEMQLRQNEALHRQILETTNDVVIMLDAKAIIRYVSGAAQPVLGYAPDELVGQSMARLQHADHAAAHAAGVARYVRSGERKLNWRSTQVPAVHRDGHDVPVEVAFGEFELSGERHFVAFLRDITDRLKSEHKQAQLQTQLLEAQKMEAIGTLAGGVAHDFNNMLGAILGNLQVAGEELAEGQSPGRSLEEVRKAADRARGLVRQILAFSRRQPPERKPCLLQDVVADAAQILRATLPAGVVIDLQMEPDMPCVLADAVQVEQIVLNLGSNAAYALGERAGRIRLRVAPVSLEAGLPDSSPALAPGHYLRLTCQDNGRGMDAATLQRIFEPFFTTKPVGSGTGLGLAAVHGIMATHEGGIAVRSEPGQGATFEVFFPVAPASFQSLGKEDANVDGSVTVMLKQPVLGQHILCVDDEESLVFLLTRLLERRGYRVSGYTDPRAALVALQADPGSFDLLVTDYNMPELSGLELARAANQLRPDLPIVLASGYITEALRVAAPAAGVKDLVYKEDVVERFCEAVARNLLPA